MKTLLIAFACIPLLVACKKEIPDTTPVPAATPPAAAAPGDTPTGTAAASMSPATETPGPAPAPATTPGNGAAGSSTAGAAQGSGDGMYVVGKGDTLYGIAEKNGINHGDLAKWNEIDNPRQLQVGRKLRLTAPGN